MAKRREYEPINPLKYTGRRPIILKSSWEESFARIYCDLNPACIDWSYEAWRIPYRDPVRCRQTIYIPDFLMSFRSNTGNIRTALIEIKPIHETLQEYARNLRDSANIARNLAKWEAARAWCERRTHVSFVVLTERELFPGGQYMAPSKRQIKPYGQRRVKKI